MTMTDEAKRYFAIEVNRMCDMCDNCDNRLSDKCVTTWSALVTEDNVCDMWRRCVWRDEAWRYWVEVSIYV